jgi:glycosyltransferase involved in cell wall biosynthesis
MNNQFRVIVPCYNAEKWIKKCIESISKQTYKEWSLLIIDDASTDNTYERAKSLNVGTVIRNETNLGALANIVGGVSTIGSSPEDIIVLVDGDDWLSNDRVFEKLNTIYNDKDAWMTYGQYQHLSGKHRGICAYLTDTRRYRKFRTWRTSHLRTFKYHLWKRIKDEDLRDSSGNYYPMTWDLSFMFPMIEMAGLNRIRYIRDILYIYNDMNPINDDKKNRELQLRLEKEIRAKPLYDEI